MTESHQCAICNSNVACDRSWVDLQGLPRMWFCHRHFGTDFRFILDGDGTWLWVRGEVVALRAPVMV